MPREHGRSYVFIAESELDYVLIPKRRSIDLTIFILIFFILMNLASLKDSINFCIFL